MIAMDLSLASLSHIGERLPQVWHTLANDPLLYIPLIAWWALFEFFFLFHASEDYHHKDVLDNGMSSIYAGMYISPIIQGGGLAEFAKFSPNSVLSLILMSYGAFLILGAFTKMIPEFLIPFFGGASIDLVVNVLAIFIVDAGLAFDLATIAIVIVPVAAFKILGLITPKMH